MYRPGWSLKARKSLAIAVYITTICKRDVHHPQGIILWPCTDSNPVNVLTSLICNLVFISFPQSSILHIMAEYKTRQVGAPNTLDYRVYFGMLKL